MKKIIVALFLGLFLLNNANAIDIKIMEGDERTACEVLLCLAAPSGRPTECVEPLKRYFKIQAKKWSKTVQKRKDFLSLCPVDKMVAETTINGVSNINDNELKEYLELISQINEDCSPEGLNRKLEQKSLGYNPDDGTNIFVYRVNPNMSRSCALLSQSKYANLKLRYTCNGNFYRVMDWQNGYEKKSITKQEYDSLSDNEKVADNTLRMTTYFKKIPIKKDCWINEAKNE